MTVSELIEMLKKYEQDGTISCVDLDQEVRPIKGICDDEDDNTYIVMGA